MYGSCLCDSVLQDSDSPLLEFLKVLSLCHTVIPETVDGEIKLRASSPDEEALIKAAISLGIKFKGRTPNSVILDVVSDVGVASSPNVMFCYLISFNTTTRNTAL